MTKKKLKLLQQLKDCSSIRASYRGAYYGDEPNFLFFFIKKEKGSISEYHMTLYSRPEDQWYGSLPYPPTEFMVSKRRHKEGVQLKPYHYGCSVGSIEWDNELKSKCAKAVAEQLFRDPEQKRILTKMILLEAYGKRMTDFLRLVLTYTLEQ